MISPQLLVSATFAVLWAVLAVYLLVWHRGPGHWAGLHLRTMGVVSALFAVYNIFRLWLEWRRLRRLKHSRTYHDTNHSSHPAD